MNYNLKVVEKLMDIEQKIFESFNLIVVYKTMIQNNKASVYFNNELERIQLLTKKEDMLLEQLPHDSETVKYIYDFVLQNVGNFFDDSNVVMPILNRFHNIMFDLSSLYFDQEEEEYFKDIDAELDSFDLSSNRVAIRNNLLKKNIKYLEELLAYYKDQYDEVFRNTQYSMAFSFKNISDYLIAKGFDITNFVFDSDENLAEKLNISFQDYKLIKADELFNMTQDLFFELLDNVYDEKNPNRQVIVMENIIRLKFLLHEMETPLLSIFYSHVFEYCKENNETDFFVDKICNVIKSELDNRGDKPYTVNEVNKKCEKIDAETVDSLISLVKLEEDILDNFDDVDLDSINNNEQIKKLSLLVAEEKLLISKIKINYKNIDIIENLFDRDIDLFLNDISSESKSRRNRLIQARLKSVIPFFRHFNMSPTQSEKSYSFINQNHLISTLKKFEKLIESSDNSEQKNHLKSFYKDLFFVNYNLMDDFIYINGNYKMIDRFSDSLTSEILGIKDIEYAYDKDEQLFEHGVDIIDSMLSFEDKWLVDMSSWATFNFHLSELSDIIDNVSDEHCYELLSIVLDDENYNSPKTKKIIRKTIGK